MSRGPTPERVILFFLTSMKHDTVHDDTEPRAKRTKIPPSSALAEARHYADLGSLAPPSLLEPHHLIELRERGWTVVENVLSPDQCETTKRDWLQTMAQYPGSKFRPDDRKTWKRVNMPLSTRGMLDFPSVAQEAWIWRTRLASAPVFSALWGCAESDLLTSMDRACFVPYEQLKMNAKNAKGWWHIDQARIARRGPLQCVQGLVTLNDMGEGEVCLEVLEGAHRHHAAFFRERIETDAKRQADTRNDDWYKFDADTGGDLAWYLSQPGVKRVRCYAKAGSLILWESRLPHQAQPPQNNALRSKIDRYAIYACMIPREWVKDGKVLQKRQKHFESGRATPHWPDSAKPFPAKPRTYGTPLPFPTYNVLESQVQVLEQRLGADDYARAKRLVGY